MPVLSPLALTLVLSLLAPAPLLSHREKCIVIATLAEKRLRKRSPITTQMIYLQSIPEQIPGELSEPPLDINGSTQDGLSTLLVRPSFWWRKVKKTHWVFPLTSLTHFARREVTILAGGTLRAHVAGEEIEKK